jgi:hypothetical protein
VLQMHVRPWLQPTKAHRRVVKKRASRSRLRGRSARVRPTP